MKGMQSTAFERSSAIGSTNRSHMGGKVYALGQSKGKTGIVCPIQLHGNLEDIVQGEELILLHSLAEHTTARSSGRALGEAKTSAVQVATI